MEEAERENPVEVTSANRAALGQSICDRGINISPDKPLLFTRPAAGKDSPFATNERNVIPSALPRRNSKPQFPPAPRRGLCK